MRPRCGFVAFAALIVSCAAGAPDSRDPRAQIANSAPPASAAPVASVAASASSPPSAASSAAPSASAPTLAPFTPPATPAAGTERRYFSVQTRGASGAAVPVSIDVPPLWAMTLAAQDRVEHRPCHAVAFVDAGIIVRASACTGGIDACIDSREHEDGVRPAAKRTKIDAARAWVIRDGDMFGQRKVSATLYAFDAPTQTIVECTTSSLGGTDLAFVDAYKAACDSLTLRPAAMPAAPARAIEARPSPEDLAPPPSPRDAAMANVARAFVAAAARRDAGAARALLVTDAQLPAGAAGETYRKNAAKAAADLPKILAKVPAPFPVGSVAVRDPGAEEHVAWVTVFKKGDECSHGIAVPIWESDGKFYVMAWSVRL